MKRSLLSIIYTFAVLMTMSFGAEGAASIKHQSGSWVVIKHIDDLTDEIVCELRTINTNKHNKPGIVIFTVHEVSGQHVIINANGGIDGVGITYRTDKDPAVTFGHEYYFQTDSDIYIPKGSEYEQLVADFKKGTSLVYKVHSGNQFVDSMTEKVSLIGFTKAYNIAEQCD